MARRLKPFPKRPASPSCSSFLALSETLLVERRPTVVPSGKRAAFIKAIEDAKAEEKRKRQEQAKRAWHVVSDDTPFKKEAERLGLDPRYLRDLNAPRLKGLQLSSFLKKDTWLQVRPV